MKNWKIILFVGAVASALTCASAQEAAAAPAAETPAPEAPAAAAPAAETPASSAKITAKKEGDGKISFNVSGMKKDTKFSDVSKDVLSSGTALMSDRKFSAPANSKAPQQGGFQTKIGTVVAEKQLVDGKMYVTFELMGMEGEKSFSEIAADMLVAVEHFITQEGIVMTGTTLDIHMEFGDNKEPSFALTFTFKYGDAAKWTDSDEVRDPSQDLGDKDFSTP